MGSLARPQCESPCCHLPTCLQVVSPRPPPMRQRRPSLAASENPEPRQRRPSLGSPQLLRQRRPSITPGGESPDPPPAASRQRRPSKAQVAPVPVGSGAERRTSLPSVMGDSVTEVKSDGLDSALTGDAPGGGGGGRGGAAFLPGQIASTHSINVAPPRRLPGLVLSSSSSSAPGADQATQPPTLQVGGGTAGAGAA